MKQTALWDKRRAARHIGIHRETLMRLIREEKIDLTPIELPGTRCKRQFFFEPADVKAAKKAYLAAWR